MALVEITCYNTDCPGYEYDTDTMLSTGHTFIATEVPATHNDPGYIEGTCPKCGELTEQYEVEQLSKYDLDAMRLAHGPGGDRI
jgi:hypothetical protein